MPNVWANEKIQKLTPAPVNRTQDLKIERQTLCLTTMDTTPFTESDGVMKLDIFMVKIHVFLNPLPSMLPKTINSLPHNPEF